MRRSEQGGGPRYAALQTIAHTSTSNPRLPGRLASTLALLTPIPRSFRLAYDPAVLEQIERLAAERRADVVIAFELAAADYVSRLDGNRYLKIVDGCEPFAFRAGGSRLRRRARIWKLRRFLRALLDRFDAYVTVSDAELAWIRTEVAPQRAWGCTVPNGAELREPYAGPIDRRRIIYNGSLTYQANLEAVDYFLHAIWPALRNRQPHARFVVTGQPPDRQTSARLSAIPGVSIAGLVDDYPRFVSSAGVLAVPLLRGGGTRIKVLEALALGCPVVATAKGVEGLELEPGRDLLMADTPSEFAAAIDAIVADDRLRARLVENGRRVAARYSWSNAQRRFAEVIDHCLEQRAFFQTAPSMVGS